MEEAENLINRFLSYGGYFDTLVPSSLFGTAAEEVINLFGLAMRSGVRATDLKHMLGAYPTHGSDVAHML
jgi:glutathione reductase (NADPH)